jgi:hypothetical protein
MIRYTLRCECGHAFESWFQDSASYDKQAKRGLVSCPACDSVKVEKSIMAPQIPRKGRTAEQRAGEEKVQRAVARKKKTEAAAVPATGAAASSPEPLVMAPDTEFRAKLKELRDHIKANADNVGDQFPEQARKMHYGEIEHRPIYGDASPTEAKALIDEGVDVLPLPVLPEDRN